MLETIQPVTQHYVPEDMYCQQSCCENVKSCNDI